MTLIAERVPVVCADSHLTEPPDLWTARLPSKFGELIPRVEYFEPLGEDVWMIGNEPSVQAWFHTMAGFDGWWPEHPRSQSEIDPAAYDPAARSRRLDEFGIRMQVIYPNPVSTATSASAAEGLRPKHQGEDRTGLVAARFEAGERVIVEERFEQPGDRVGECLGVDR